MNNQEDLIKNIENWIALSSSNLEACKVVYKNENYPEASNLFQQSVEKSTKAMGLFTGSIKETNLDKEIKHETIKIFERDLNGFMVVNKNLIKTFQKKPELRSLKLFESINPNELQEELIDSVKLLEKLKDERNSIGKTSKEIERYINKINKFTKLEEKISEGKFKLEVTDKKFEQAKKDIYDSMLELFKVLGKQDSEEAEKFKKDFAELTKEKFVAYFREYLQYLISCLSIYMTNLYLTILTLRHTNSPRYIIAGKNPLEIYSKKFPFVRRLPLLIKIQEDNLLKIEKLLKNYSENLEKNKNATPN